MSSSAGYGSTPEAVEGGEAPALETSKADARKPSARYAYAVVAGAALVVFAATRLPYDGPVTAFSDLATRKARYEGGYGRSGDDAAATGAVMDPPALATDDAAAAEGGDAADGGDNGESVDGVASDDDPTRVTEADDGDDYVDPAAAKTGYTYSNGTKPKALPLKFELVYDYSAPESMGYYPWDYLVEPFRSTVLQPVHRVKDAEYTWTLELPGMEGKESEMVVRGVKGETLTHSFSYPGRFYNLHLVETSGSHGERWLKEEIICKYVRRELRKLNDADRGLYFEALKQIYTLSMPEGKAMRLRESAWTDLGSLYESGRAAELRSDEEHAQLHEFRSWLYDDESIHDTIDFETGEYR